MSDKVTFVPVNSSHRPLLRRWLASPHVREWWGDPEQELKLIGHGKDIDGTEGFTIMLDQAPVGYIQSWVPSQFDNEGWEQRLSPDVRGIDVFIVRCQLWAREQKLSAPLRIGCLLRATTI